MGVEYRHFLVTAEPSWLPHPDTLSRVDAVLRKWQLVVEAPEIYDLSGGHMRAISEIPTTPPGPGIAVVYPHVEGPVAALLFGRSYYPNIPDDDRYIQRISVVAGSDYRIQCGDEGICFTVVEPPREEGREIEPYSDAPSLFLYCEAYPRHPLDFASAHGDRGRSQGTREHIMAGLHRSLARRRDIGLRKGSARLYRGSSHPQISRVCCGNRHGARCATLRSWGDLLKCTIDLRVKRRH